MATAINMFLNVFRKTPTSCSSTKFAELSKPLIPRRAAQKPSAIALKRPSPDGRVPRLALKILNVKYLIITQKVEHAKLNLTHVDKQNNLYLYRYEEHMPRSFFIGTYQIIKDEYQRLETINQVDFDPQDTVILEENLNQPISKPDSCYSNVTDFTPNRVNFDVFTDKTALLVISELYYPPGWKIYIDNKQVDKIYKANHAIQAIVVPKGKHKIDIRFEPASYYRNIKLQ